MPAGSTYSTIATYTVPSAQASYTFSSIPSTYTDLVLIMNNIHTTNAVDAWFQLNGDTGTNYSRTNLIGDGSAAASGRNTNVGFGYGLLTYTSFSTNRLHFNNYSNTTTNKTVLIRADNAGNYATTAVDLWRNTSAINSIKIGCISGSFDVGSTFTLYGITAA
jgi:hypothetical protein